MCRRMYYVVLDVKSKSNKREREGDTIQKRVGK